MEPCNGCHGYKGIVDPDTANCSQSLVRGCDLLETCSGEVCRSVDVEGSNARNASRSPHHPKKQLQLQSASALSMPVARLPENPLQTQTCVLPQPGPPANSVMTPVRRPPRSTWSILLTRNSTFIEYAVRMEMCCDCEATYAEQPVGNKAAHASCSSNRFTPLTG